MSNIFDSCQILRKNKWSLVCKNVKKEYFHLQIQYKQKCNLSNNIKDNINKAKYIIYKKHKQ